jgi:hypothetical protein
VATGSLWTGFRGGIRTGAGARPFLLLEKRMHSKFKITSPDQGLAGALQHKIDQKTKPRGDLEF